MAKKINIVGAKPKKIEVVDQPKRRIDPAEFGAALGAIPSGRQAPGNLDPIALAELGTQLLNRLRSSGGRPALADATINCRVPLSAEDIQTLENMVLHIGASAGAKPSVGQLVSVIVRLHLNALKSASGPIASADVAKQDVEHESSRSILRQMIDEQLNPIREQVKRLETELHALWWCPKPIARSLEGLESLGSLSAEISALTAPSR
jgi:hypothetical protein